LPLSHKIFATARPTVPKPISAILQAELLSAPFSGATFVTVFETLLDKPSA
jgi:hypothetical protein